MGTSGRTQTQSHTRSHTQLQMQTDACTHAHSKSQVRSHAQTQQQPPPHGNTPLAAWIHRVGSMHHAGAGITLFAQGSAAHQIWYIDDGWVTLLRTEGTGVDVIVDLRSASTLIGAGAALARSPHPVTAVARTPVRLWSVSLPALEDAFHGDRTLREALVRELALETILQVARCGALGCLDAREHLERLLRQFVAPASALPVRIPLSVTELAGLLGVDISHACRLLRTLKREGIIETVRGWIVVRDPARLHVLRRRERSTSTSHHGNERLTPTGDGLVFTSDGLVNTRTDGPSTL